jgi:hypothetical protein
MVSRLMYAKGYDFGHFVAMSVAPMMIEVLVRVCYSAKRLNEGFDLIASLPFQVPGSPPPPKLHTMLFVAHLISTAADAGRVCLGPVFNPLAINHPQWVAVTKYALGQLRWVLEQREHASAKAVQLKLDSDWQALNLNLQSWWTPTFGVGGFARAWERLNSTCRIRLPPGRKPRTRTSSLHRRRGHQGRGREAAEGAQRLNRIAREMVGRPRHPAKGPRACPHPVCAGSPAAGWLRLPRLHQCDFIRTMRIARKLRFSWQAR